MRWYVTKFQFKHLYNKLVKPLKTSLLIYHFLDSPIVSTNRGIFYHHQKINTKRISTKLTTRVKNAKLFCKAPPCLLALGRRWWLNFRFIFIFGSIRCRNAPGPRRRATGRIDRANPRGGCVFARTNLWNINSSYSTLRFYLPQTDFSRQTLSVRFCNDVRGKAAGELRSYSVGLGMILGWYLWWKRC